jgi:hypothetical protein
MYLLAMGGDYPVLFLGLWLFFLLVQHTLVVMTPRILGYWARQYDLYPASDVPVILQVQLMKLTVHIPLTTTLAT